MVFHLQCRAIHLLAKTCLKSAYYSMLTKEKGKVPEDPFSYVRLLLPVFFAEYIHLFKNKTKTKTKQLYLKDPD